MSASVVPSTTLNAPYRTSSLALGLNSLHLTLRRVHPGIRWVPLFHLLHRLLNPAFFHVQSNSVPFDPPIVDSMAELDQIFSPQHVAANARRIHSPNSEQLTSSSSEPDTPELTSSRPKLSHALSHLTFSPKRPRFPALPLRSASPVQPHNSTHGGDVHVQSA